MRNIAIRRGAVRAATRLQGLRKQGGVMLLEALVAILIFSIGIIAVLGMQAVSITQVSQSKYRTDAAYLANQLIGLMWVADKTTLPAFAGGGGVRAAWDATVAASLPQGAGNVVVNGSAVTITITWRMPDDVRAHRYVAVANLNASD
jgi:type IV pilus assembly protein PilV